MDIPVVLSHKTAWLLRRTKHFSQLCDRARQRGSECGELPFLEDEDLLDIGLGELGLPAHTIVQRVRDALHSWGVPVEELNSVDVLVPFANDRVRTEHLACHSHGQIVHEENVIPVARGLLSVGNPLCFAQAATWMNRRELIEFGYELCADYFTPFDSSYVEHKPYSSCDELEARLKGAWWRARNSCGEQSPCVCEGRIAFTHGDGDSDDDCMPTAAGRARISEHSAERPRRCSA